MGSLELCFSLFLVLSLFVFFFYQVNEENVDSRYYESLKIHHVFSCRQCGALYGSCVESEEAECPHCHTKNTYLRF